MTIHIELKNFIESHYAHHLEDEVELKQDALLAQFDSGLAIEIRYLNPGEYSIQWSWGDAELRIDTAPLHKMLPTFPNHLHDSMGNLRPDTLTVPGNSPLINVRHLLDRLLKDPLLEAG